MNEKIREYLKTISCGKVTTYKQISERLGNKSLVRYVGNVLHKNSNVLEYPCYKVVTVKGTYPKIIRSVEL